MKYSLIFSGVEGALAFKNYLESKEGISLLESQLDEHQSIRTSCKFIFNIGIDDHRKVAEVIETAALPVTVSDTLRQEITSVNEY